MKISVFSFAVNDKFPIDIAYRKYKKFIKEDFEFVLFNDASDPQMEQNINIIANCNNIKCVRVPQNIHTIYNPSVCYASTLNWAIHNYAKTNNCEIVILSHTDVFPICEISILDIIGNNMAASTTEFRILDGKAVTYFYPALTIVNMKLIKNIHELDFSLSPGLDTGGKTKDFIRNNSDLVKFIANHPTSYFFKTLLENDPFVEYFKNDLDICRKYGLNAGWIAEGFYHYMAGSQWNADNVTFTEGHKKRMDLFLTHFY